MKLVQVSYLPLGSFAKHRTTSGMAQGRGSRSGCSGHGLSNIWSDFCTRIAAMRLLGVPATLKL